MQASSDAGLKGFLDVFVNPLAIEPFRIEVAAAPTFEVGMLGMAAIGYDRKEFLIAASPANVFGRARTGAPDTGSRARCDLKGEKPLHLDGMSPTVTQVIEIRKPKSVAPFEVEKADLPFVKQAGVGLEPEIVVSIRIAITQTTDLEFMQMVVPPIESGLNAEVQLSQMPGQRHDETTPDHRLDLVEHNSELH